MDPQETTEQPAKEQRILAAIVFTDAVSFSKLAGKDEQAALSILNRDFRLMSEFCERQGGRVLKTMGDGMLMMFPSAVDAMQAALNIQDALYSQAQRMPAISVLQHRIGVHLGDIIINGDDVFGDGVNVASRLQTEAKPGAICFSRTVADVIKNKVQVSAKYLGPRVLKNIAEPVMVWQVPPIEETGDVGSMDAQAFSDIKQEDEGIRGSKAFLIVIASIVLLGGAIGALTLIKPGPERHSTKLPRKTNVKKPAATEPAVTPAPGVNPPDVTPPVNSTNPPPDTTTMAVPADIQARLDAMKKTYDFAAIRDLLGPYINESSGQVAKLQAHYDQLAQMRAWIEREIAGATATNPIAVPVSGTTAQFFAGRNGVAVETDGTVSEMSFSELPPSTVLGIANTLLLKQPSGAAAPPMAQNWAGQFQTEFGL